MNYSGSFFLTGWESDFGSLCLPETTDNEASLHLAQGTSMTKASPKSTNPTKNVERQKTTADG